MSQHRAARLRRRAFLAAAFLVGLGAPAAAQDASASAEGPRLSPFFQTPFALVAHRGGAAQAPENTLYAFRRTLEAHPDAILEADARLSADGEVVLLHDETVDRTTDGNGVVGMLTLADLKDLDAGHHFTTDGGVTHPQRGQGRRIPTLSEVLIALPDARFEIELKEGAKLLAATLDVIRTQAAQDRVLLASTNPAVIERARQRAPEIAVCLPEATAIEVINKLRKEGVAESPYPGALLCASVEDVERFKLQAREIRALAAAGLPTQVFTVNDADRMASLLAMGVSSIVTDFPDRLARALEERAPGGVVVPTAAAEERTPYPEDIGTLVVLGDSIGDPTDARQKPYHLLAFADLQGWRGKEIDYRPVARAGSRSRDLHGQIRLLPARLEGPVIVFVTIGGNDMRDAAPLIVMNADSAKREELEENLGRAIDSLLEADRFGEDVDVRVYVTNIYDPTDGRGNFQELGCPTPIRVADSDPMFERWNEVVARTVRDRGQTLIDMHGAFRGHGRPAGASSWLLADCIHPNEDGHDQLRELFFQAVTGEKPPEGGLAADLDMPIGKGLHEGEWIFKLRSGQTFRARNYYDLGDSVQVKRVGIEIKIDKEEIESIKPTR